MFTVRALITAMTYFAIMGLEESVLEASPSPYKTGKSLGAPG